MLCLARKRGNADRAAPKRKKKKQAAKTGTPAKVVKPQQKPVQSRYVGNVPPLDAFDNIRRRPPPAHQMSLNRGEAVPFEVSENRELSPDASGKRKGEKKQKAASASKKGITKVRNPGKRRQRRRIIAVLLALLLIAGGVWFTITVLFKIDKYDVQGQSRYSVQEIATAFGHAPGDNMYGFSVANAKERILAELPYIEQINIRRRLPSTIVFEVVQAIPTYSLACEGGFAVLSANMKVLEVSETQPEELTVIEGLSCVIVEQGKQLTLNEEELAVIEGTSSVVVSSAVDSLAESGSDASAGSASQDEPPSMPDADIDYSLTPRESFAALLELIEGFEVAGLADINYVDVEDILNIKFGWQNRATVLLGPRSNMQDKLNAAATLLHNEIGPDESGTLDMTYHTSTGKVYWNNT